MPDDKKVPAKPRYKVEEVSEEKEVPPLEEKKITSFSMIDTPVAEKPEEKELENKHTEDAEAKEDEDTEPVHKPEESDPPVIDELHAEEPKAEIEENDEIKKWLEHVP